MRLSLVLVRDVHLSEEMKKIQGPIKVELDNRFSDNNAISVIGSYLAVRVKTRDGYSRVCVFLTEKTLLLKTLEK